ncbi:MAG TPA: MarR family winged helix-turn-helix transcriptional regulator [Terriglobales bacterium]|nr:MarR family winged helix-turn-helix transcriptional regulator [Terriglobales bacterium]
MTTWMKPTSDKSKTQDASDYESLAEVRYQLRRFLHFSERAAREAGLEPQQHQLLLAVKGLPAGARPRVAELAERLQIKHHSAVELINRLASAGCVKRHRAGADRREVLIALTPKGERILRALSDHHRAELRKRGPLLIEALRRAMGTNGSRRNPGAGRNEKNSNNRRPRVES